MKARFFTSGGVGVSSTIYEATPISTNSSVHTTGNSHEGGDSGGCFSASKSFILPIVKSAEKPPIAKGIIMDIARDL